MKKQFKGLTLCLSLIFCMLATTSVFSSWTYYEGPVEPVSTEITNIELGEFIYDYSDVHPGFEKDPGGHNASHTIDKILDTNTGVQDLNGEFHQLLESIPVGQFVTSVDTNVLTGNDIDSIKEIAGIGEHQHFLIQKVSSFYNERVYHVYTTDFPVENIKLIEYVDENGVTQRKYNTLYIYDVYESTITFYDWSAGDYIDGQYNYIVEETKKGYADPVINPNNNNTQPFFNPSTWHEGSYIKLNNAEIVGPNSIYIDEEVKLSVNLDPYNTTQKDIIWSIDNPNVATISQDGLLTPKKAGFVTVSIKTTDFNVKPKKFTIEIKERSSIQINPESVQIIHNAIGNNIVMGQDIQLDTLVLPKETSNKNVIWSTSDDNIATINENGLLHIKNGNGVKNVTVYAKSVMDQSISDAITFIVNPARSDSAIDGSFEINNDRTLRVYKAREASLNDTDYLFNDQFNNTQAIKFVIPKQNPNLRVKLTFNSSDPNAEITSLHYTQEDNKLISEMFDKNSKELILVGNTYTDMSYYIKFTSTDTIEYTIEVI